MKYLFVLWLALAAMSAGARSFGSVADVDLTISNLVLTTGSEKTFQYSFDLTNNGASAIQGYTMKLTFSADNVLDASDDFFLIMPLENNSSQAVGANQTVSRNVQYTANSPVGYLPAGSWYIIAEINYDRIVAETDYDNNSTLSTNKITVNNYTIGFTTTPSITNITDNSFVIMASFDPDMTRIYYRVLPDGGQAPNKNTMLSSDGMFPWETQVTISDLGPAFDYDVYLMGEFFDQKVTSIYKLDVKTLGAVAPTLVLTPGYLTLSATSISSNSSSSVYSVTGFHLTSDVTITSTGNFAISKDDQTYVNQLTFPESTINQGKSQWVYVKFIADGEAGLKSGSVVNASAGAGNKVIAVSLFVYDPTNLNFDGLSSLEETGWSTYSIAGYHAWSLVDLEESSPQKRVSGDDKAIQIDGSINGFTENEDWLISPAVDLSSYTYDPTVRLKSFSSGAGPSLKLKYSANYNGTGDPRTAVWFDADIEFPAVNSNAWGKSSVVIPNKESRIFFALVYTSTTSAGSRWTIDDWKITDNLLSIPTNTLSYNNIEVGTSSDSKPMQVKIVGYGDVTVSASDGFQVSLDNISFSSSIVISESDVEAGKTIFVRFTPIIQTQGLQGTLTFSGNDLLVSRNTLIGTSLLTTAVSKPIESANVIYPNPTPGAVHLDMSILSGQQGDVPIIVVNSMGSIVAEIDCSLSSLEAQLSEILTNLQPGLYYITLQLEETIYRDKIMKL
jgi:hypothetical protein